MDARDVDLSVTRMRRPRAGARAPKAEQAARAAYATRGSAALALPPEESDASHQQAPPAQRSPRLAVAPPPLVAVPRAPFVVLVLLVVVGGVVGILLLNTKVNENAFVLHDLRQEQAALDQRQQQLEEQIAQADSPGHLTAAALRMGLVRADELAYLRLPAGEVVSEPVPAAGEPSRASQVGGETAGGEPAAGAPASGEAEDSVGAQIGGLSRGTSG